MHEENFQRILSKENVQDYQESKGIFLKDQKDIHTKDAWKVREYFEEIGINFASILIMLEKSKDAFTMLDRIELSEMCDLKTKLLLIKVSL